MKKILFGITSLTLGGAERVLIDIANKLSDKYEITIFTIYGNGDLESELNSNIKVKHLYNKKYTELNKFQKIIIPLKILLNKKRIYRKYIDGDYITQISFLEGAITRLFSVKSKINENCKKIVWIHNDISKVFGKNIKSKIKLWLDKMTYTKYNTLIFVSKDNLKAFTKVYPKINENEKKVIYNYINPKRVLEKSINDKEYNNKFNDKEINLVQVSRLVEQKAIERLIKVHTKLIKEGKKYHIYIVGEGPLEEKLKKQIQENNIEDTFTLLGAKSNPYPYIKNATAFILFSNYEGYPMVIEEAKILNKYIAITDTAAREVLTNYDRNSIIVENNENGIEKGLRNIIENTTKISDKANKNYVYNNDSIIDEIIDIIE